MLHIREWGCGNAVCVLIHGFGEGAYVWNEFAAKLAPFYRIFAIDLRGHGESDWDSAGQYGVRIDLADVIHCIETIGLDRVHVVGHSLGGSIGIRLAVACPDRVRGLVVVDFGPDLNREGSVRVQSDFIESARRYTSVAEFESWLASKRPLVAPEVLTRLAHEALRADPRGGFHLKADPAMGRRADDRNEDGPSGPSVWTLLRQIRCRVLVVRGAVSAILSQRVAEQMVHALGDGRLRIVSRAGHAVMADNAAEFESVVGCFLLESRCG
jgi:pimeloyl-ACP methyl ester carboxylesterase